MSVRRVPSLRQLPKPSRPTAAKRRTAPPRRIPLVIATRNPGKLREYATLLGDLPVVLHDLDAFPGAPEVPEDQDTYLGNARQKALAVARFTRLPTLADDSGLEVDALGGQPGVRSARYAGPAPTDRHNIALLLERLSGVPSERRRARFRCVIVVAQPAGELLSSEGICEGWITTEARGRGGFGYDPVFYFPAAGRTFAEIAPDEKNRVSHRAHACERLAPRLLAFLRYPTRRRGEHARRGA